MTTTRIAGLMAGKTVLVTGATGGIGKATALGLARMGACSHHRSPPRSHRGRRPRDPSCRRRGGSLRRRPVQPVTAARPRCGGPRSPSRIDVLVNNVGGFWNTRHVTEDGYERTFALNHLAPFLLTNLLLDRMQHSTAARVVTVSSNAHAMGRIDFENLQGKGPTPEPRPTTSPSSPTSSSPTSWPDGCTRPPSPPMRCTPASCAPPSGPRILPASSGSSSRGSTLHEKPDPGRRDVHPRGVRPGTQTCQRTLLRKPHREEVCRTDVRPGSRRATLAR